MIRPILLVEDNPMDVELTLMAFSRGKIANPLVARDGDRFTIVAEQFQTYWGALNNPPD